MGEKRGRRGKGGEGEERQGKTKDGREREEKDRGVGVEKQGGQEGERDTLMQKGIKRVYTQRGFTLHLKLCIPFSPSSMQSNTFNQENTETKGWRDRPMVKSPCCSCIGPRFFYYYYFSGIHIRRLTITYNSSSRESNF